MDVEMLKSLFPLACIHTLGNMLTNISVTQVAVSFTHTVKVGCHSRSLCPSPSSPVGDSARADATVLHLRAGVGAVLLGADVVVRWDGLHAAAFSSHVVYIVFRNPTPCTAAALSTISIDPT